MCMFCRSVFVILSFFFWPLCCLSYFTDSDYTLLSSNSSHKINSSLKIQRGLGHEVKHFFYTMQWVLIVAKWAIFQLHHSENKFNFNEIMTMSAMYQTNTLSWICIELSHWNNSLYVDMSLLSDTLSWLLAD